MTFSSLLTQIRYAIYTEDYLTFGSVVCNMFCYQLDTNLSPIPWTSTEYFKD